MIIAIVCLCSMFHVLVQCYGQNVSPEVQGHLCLQACQVCHCYPENQRVILINSHKKKKKKNQKSVCRNWGSVHTSSPALPGGPGGPRAPTGPLAEKKRIKDLTDQRALIYT